MPTKLKRITFAVTPDIENILDEAKKFFIIAHNLKC